MLYLKKKLPYGRMAGRSHPVRATVRTCAAPPPAILRTGQPGTRDRVGRVRRAGKRREGRGARTDGYHGPARGQAIAPRRALCAESDGAAGRSAPPAATPLLPASPPLAGCSSQPDQRATVRVTGLIQITGYGERASEGTRRARRAPPERQCGW